MNETQEMNPEQGAVSGMEMNASRASVAQSVPDTQSSVPSEAKELIVDSVPAAVAEKPAPTIASSGGVSVGDIWSNEETSFRVDEVTAVGGVNIRFRTQDTLEGSKSSFIRKAQALFKMNLPDGNNIVIGLFVTDKKSEILVNGQPYTAEEFKKDFNEAIELPID